MTLRPTKLNLVTNSPTSHLSSAVKSVNFTSNTTTARVSTIINNTLILLGILTYYK